MGKTDQILQFIQTGDINSALSALNAICPEHYTELKSRINELSSIHALNNNPHSSEEAKININAYIANSIHQIITLLENETTNSKKEIRAHLLGPLARIHLAGIQKNPDQANLYAIVLQEENGPYQLPIVVGAYEAQSIVFAMEKRETNKPQTHDLMKNIINETSFSLKEIVIDGIENGIFSCKIVLTTETKHIELDSRVSDALSLAALFQSPMFICRSVLEAVGFAG
jgi:bifunctional DNase/RNase